MTRIRKQSAAFISHLPISHRKGLPLPVFIEMDPPITSYGEQVGGMYMPPQGVVELFDGTVCDTRRGVIVVGCVDDGTSITHEFRHHAQYFTGRHFDDPTPWSPTGNYKRDIVRYFTGDITEMDALLYQVKYAPEQYVLQWLDWIRDEETIR